VLQYAIFASSRHYRRFGLERNIDFMLVLLLGAIRVNALGRPKAKHILARQPILLENNTHRRLRRRVVRTTLIAAVALIVASALTASSSQANTITQMLGTANYTNGQSVGTATFAVNPSSDPAPFDTLIGNKSAGPNPSTTITFGGYGGAIAAPITSATLEIGLYDAASPTPSTEVQFFTLNSTIDIAAVLTAALVADPATRAVETYYTLNLPSTTFSALATGSSTFALGFQGQGVGVLGPTNFTLFGLDFATLSIITTPAPVPGPVMGGGLPGLIVCCFGTLIFVKRGFRRSRVDALGCEPELSRI